MQFFTLALIASISAAPTLQLLNNLPLVGNLVPIDQLTQTAQGLPLVNQVMPTVQGLPLVGPVANGLLGTDNIANANGNAVIGGLGNLL
jgi:hypothetical protein